MATISVPAGTLATGSAKLAVSYTPDSAGSLVYGSASGSASVRVTNQTTPTVTVGPASQSLSTSSPLNVTVTVSGPSQAGPNIYDTFNYANGTQINGLTMPSGNAQWSVTGMGGVRCATVQNTLLVNNCALGSNNYYVSFLNAPSVGGTAQFDTSIATTFQICQPSGTYDPTITSASLIAQNSDLHLSGALHLILSPTGWALQTLVNGTFTVVAERNYAGGRLVADCSTKYPLSMFLDAAAQSVVIQFPDGSTFTGQGASSGSANYYAPLANLSTTGSIQPKAWTLQEWPKANSAINQWASVAAGGPSAPTGSVVLSSGGYASSAITLSGGSASISIPAYSLGSGSDTLSASYTPDTQSSAAYNSATGTATVSVTTATPMVNVTPASLSIDMTQSLSVTVAVSGPGTGASAPSGAVSLSGGGYTSPSPVALTAGSASVTIPAGALAAGSDTLTASYTPDGTSATWYNSTTGTSAPITVISASTVSVTQGASIGTVTDQLMGMNLAASYDVVGNASSINPAFAQSGIKAIRWPGGLWSDAWHWRTSATNLLPYTCNSTGTGTGWGGYSSFSDFVTAIPKAGNYDLALTANYGSNATCDGGGDPTEAAAWAAEAVAEGYPPSHMTVGNENYGSWEYDLHANKNDPVTYASSVAGSNGYYTLIKAASPTTRVGVVVDAGSVQPAWDTYVLSHAEGSYDFVEFHWYPENPGQEDDTYLVHTAAQDLAAAIQKLKTEMTAANVTNVPIYVGEMGSVSSNPGKQSWSITQGLYAGQTLGEMMNSGVARATWWIGFGNCNAAGNGNVGSSLYGWQTFGANNVFSDADPGCPGEGPIGTMSPTARAFQLFSNIAESGASHSEDVLSTTVTGDTTNIRAYAATNNGGTALLVFNLNENQSEPVTITLSIETGSSPDVKVITYDKAIYDQTHAAKPVWADPRITDLGAQNLPLKLTLTPWSMNVVIIK
jgi:hypothetical protein